MSEEIIDLKDVLERVQDDKELLLELFDIFQEDFVNKRKALAEAVTAGNIPKVKEVAHSMKGSSGNISAKSMYATCLQLEQLAKSNSTDGMQTLVTNIDSQFDQVRVFVAAKKKEWGGG